MDKDKEITKVLFRKFVDNGEVIALFPEIPADMNVCNCLSYLHVGQHGAASLYLLWDKRTVPATPNEYQDLYEELLSIGYNLKVVNRVTYQMNQIRMNAIQELIQNAIRNKKDEANYSN